MFLNKFLDKFILIIPLLVFIFVIFKIFTIEPNNSWKKNFEHFSVPANSYPGGDSRNIQLSAYCTSKYNSNNYDKCYSEAYPTKELYPSITIPPYNYPEIWKSIYIIFDDYSENFFMFFFKINAFSLILTIFFLALRTKLSFFIVGALSPVTLLAIERGNIDALTFFIIFFPILFSSRLYIFNSFFITLAASVKIFPIFAIFVYFLNTLKKKIKISVIGFLTLLPLFLWSLSNIKISDTTYGFKVAYGFFSLLNAPYIKNNQEIGYFILLLITFMMFFFYFYQKKNKIYQNLFDEISDLNLRNTFLFFSSILIFGFTFLFFVNWSYRLIFLIPAMFVLGRLESSLSKKILIVFFLIFWSPVFGWNLQNLMCYFLFSLLVPIYIKFFNYKKIFNNLFIKSENS